MVKRLVGIALVITVTFFVSSFALAKPPMAAKARHADKNKDGVVDKKEVKMEKKWETKQKAKVNTQWEKKADTDKDGVVEKGEAAKWKDKVDINNNGVIDPKERRMNWLHARSKVNTPAEMKYDANGDGWLEPAEAKEFLKDRNAIIQTQGQAKVDSAIEKEYDTNADGVIDRDEAKALKEDTGK